ncbi:MAG: hypothetical protein ACRC0M_06080 [Legionella sp.]
MQYLYLVLNGLQLRANYHLTHFLGVILMSSRLKTYFKRSFFISVLLCSAAHAAMPLWTVVPVAGSNPNQTVAQNSTITLTFPSADYVKGGVRIDFGSLSLLNSSFTSLNSAGQVVDSAPIQPLSGVNEYTFDLTGVEVNRFRLSMDAWAISSVNVYYFCAGL